MIVRRSVLFFLLISAVGSVQADDVGIAEVRLIEQKQNIYALEVDVSPYLLNTINTPLLPDRCNIIGKPEKVTVGPILVVRYHFTSGEIPLQSGDKLLLFWQRSGVLLTAYWLDGTSQRVFFDRGLTGISIPVSRLRDVELTQAGLVRQGINDGLLHISRMWFLHVLLVIACTALDPSVRRFWLILAFSAGQGLSLIATDLGMANLFDGGVPVLMGVVALMILVTAVQDRKTDHRFWPVLLVLGFIHSLGYAGPEFEQHVQLSHQQLITARFGFNLAIDILHTLIGGMLWSIIVLMTGHDTFRRFRQAGIYLGGGLAVAVVIIFLPGALTQPPEQEKKGNPSVPKISGGGYDTRAASRPVAVTDPVAGFITITPFEIRCEWLIRARDFDAPTKITTGGEAVIPVSVQEDFKKDLLNRFVKQTLLSVDGRQINVSDIQADFVTVANYGVSTRRAAVDEPLNQAAIGLSLAYVVDAAPSDVALRLSPYPESIPSIPVAFTDPWGSSPGVLTSANPRVDWKRRMAAFRRPVIKAVEIDPVTWPLVSMLLIGIAAGIWFMIRRGWRKNLNYGLILLCLVTALGAYPFVRLEMPVAVKKRVPPAGEMRNALDKLLTNIYRAFDYRTEEAIYDRLAISAAGNQLAAIYLQHRVAMEVENRGGARASVDDVEILEIGDIKATEEGLEVFAAWMVSGSVNHFGHIHYRKNRYRAFVRLTAREGLWKIAGIELTEEERIL